jgi:hypothetical protein
MRGAWPTGSAIIRSLMVLVRLEEGDLAGARGLAADVLRAVAGPLHGMLEDANWLWAVMLLAQADGRNQGAAASPAELAVTTLDHLALTAH